MRKSVSTNEHGMDGLGHTLRGRKKEPHRTHGTAANRHSSTAAVSDTCQWSTLR